MKSLGNAILVRPITQKGERSVSAYLPGQGQVSIKFLFITPLNTRHFPRSIFH